MDIGGAKFWLKSSALLTLLAATSPKGFAQSPGRSPLKLHAPKVTEKNKLGTEDQRTLNVVGPSYFTLDEDLRTLRSAKDPYKEKIQMIRRRPDQYSGPYLNLQFGMESSLQNIPRKALDSLIISYASGVIRNVHNPKIARDSNAGDGLTLFVKILIGKGDLHFNPGEMSLVGNLLAREDFKENLGHILEALDIAFPSEEEALKKIKEIVPHAKQNIPLLPDFTSPAEIHEAMDTASKNIFNNLAYVMVYAKLQDIQKNTPSFSPLKFDDKKLQDFILELSDHKHGKQSPVEFPFFVGAQSNGKQKLHGTYAECLERSMAILAKIECLNSFVTAASYPALQMVVREMAEQKFNNFAESEILPELLASGLKKHLRTTYDANEQKHAIMNFADHVAGGLVDEQVDKLRKAIVQPEKTPPSEIKVRVDGLEQLQQALHDVLAKSKNEIEEKGKGKTVTSFMDSVLVSAHSSNSVSPSDQIILKNIETFRQEGPQQNPVKLFIASLLLNSENYGDYKNLLVSNLKDPSKFLLRFETQLQHALENKTLSPKHGEEDLSTYLSRLLKSQSHEPAIINDIVGDMSSLVTDELRAQFRALESGEPNDFPIYFRPEIEQTLNLIRIAHSIEDFSYEGKNISCRANNQQMLSVLGDDLRRNGGKSFSENPTQFAADYIQKQEREKALPSLIDCVIMGYAKLGTFENVVLPLKNLSHTMNDGKLKDLISPLAEGTQASLESKNIFHYLQNKKSTSQPLKLQLHKDLQKAFSPENLKIREGLGKVIRNHVPRLISDALSSSFSTQNFQKGLFESTQTLQKSAHESDQENKSLMPRFPHLTPERYERLYDELRSCSEMYTQYSMKQFAPLIEHAVGASIDQIQDKLAKQENTSKRIPIDELIDVNAFYPAKEDLVKDLQSEAATEIQKNFSRSAQESYKMTTLSPEMQLERQRSSVGISSLLFELFVYQKIKEKEHSDAPWKKFLDLIHTDSDFNKKDYFFTFNDALVRSSTKNAGSFLDQETKGSILLRDTLRNVLSPSTKIAQLANFVADLEDQNNSDTPAFKEFLNLSCQNGSPFFWESDLSLEQIYQVWKSQKSKTVAEEDPSQSSTPRLEKSENTPKH